MTAVRPDPVRIDDLARPVFPPASTAMRDGLAAYGATLELSPAALTATAADRTGLRDFGDPAFAGRLTTLCAALNTEADVTDLSLRRCALRASIGARLRATRLSVTDGTVEVMGAGTFATLTDVAVSWTNTAPRIASTCVVDEDCRSVTNPDGGTIQLRCLTQFTAGYCGLPDCVSSADCPLNSICVAHEDGNNYCFRVCDDKPECNTNRAPDVEANCSSSFDWATPSDDRGEKACIPPSSGL